MTYFKAMMVDYMAMTWMVMNTIQVKVTRPALGTGSTQQGMILQILIQSPLIRQNEVSYEQKIRLSYENQIVNIKSIKFILLIVCYHLIKI